MNLDSLSQTTNSEYCDVRIVGGVAWKTIPYAIAVRRARAGLASHLSVNIGLTKDEGTISSLYKKWIESGNTCGASATSGTFKVDVAHFFVPMIVMIIVGVCSVVLAGMMNRGDRTVRAPQPRDVSYGHDTTVHSMQVESPMVAAASAAPPKDLPASRMVTSI